MEHANIDETNLETISINIHKLRQVNILLCLKVTFFSNITDFEVLEAPNREQNYKNRIFTFFIISIRFLRR